MDIKNNKIPIRFRGIPENIAKEIMVYEDYYFCDDNPIPFNELEIFPIPMNKYNEFMSYTDCCTLNKNSDPKGITKTHWEYLCSKFDEEENGKIWVYKFTKLIELVFHLKLGVKCQNCGKIISYTEYSEKVENFFEYKERVEKGEIERDENIKGIHCSECNGTDFYENVFIKTDEKTGKHILKLNNVEFSAKDFDRLRYIILFQNLPDYRDDSWVHPDIRKDQELKAKMTASSQGIASLEQKKVCVSVATHYTLEEINKLTIRKFLKIFSSMDDLIEYQIRKLGLMTGMVSSKSPIEHWVYKKEKSMYGTAVDAGKYKSMIESTKG